METNELLTIILIVLVGCFGLLATIELGIGFIIGKLSEIKSKL